MLWGSGKKQVWRELGKGLLKDCKMSIISGRGGRRVGPEKPKILSMG